jgi:hemin uptake protein HemP
MKETRSHIDTKYAALPNVAALMEKKLRIESNSLFQGKSEVIILHQNEEYNLRITKNGKLILTK